MRLKHIAATGHAAGNRIDISWVNPEPVGFPGVRLVRREGTHPTAPDDGHVVIEGVDLYHGENAAGERLYAVTDNGLEGETVYYYMLFPYQGDPPDYRFDRANRAAAMASAPYGMARRLHALLPAIYHRYDDRTSDRVAALEDAQAGQLRRFLDLPGTELDQLYSFARALLHLYDRDRVDGRLLPLLAQWIAWRTDHRLEIDRQRNELRDAPASYRRIGLIPTVEATVKRLSGWESRTKEFVHNVFRTNQPERLNLWLETRDAAETWSESAAPLSLDFAYEGRPAAVRDGDGTTWLFYHTLRKGQWDIWFKTHRAGSGWSPSEPLTGRKETDKHPTAVVRGDTVWVFWDVYDPVSQTFRIDFRTHAGGVWSPIGTLADPEAVLPERKRPFAVLDDQSPAGLWLFRHEKLDGRWRLRYNRHDGAGWTLGAPADFPLASGGDDPRVEDDAFILFHPAAPAQPLWLFWARQEAMSQPGQSRWSLVYRVKGSLDPGIDDWGSIEALPRSSEDYHDREPAAMLAAGGSVELFWASDRSGSWTVHEALFDLPTASWSAAAAVTRTPFAQRAPSPVRVGDETWLVYRNSRGVTYRSEVYRATETVDLRYSGSTTAQVRNTARTELRGGFDDFGTYTYDTGLDGRRSNEDWYSRDTIGLFLTPEVAGPDDIARGIARIDRVMGEFMPITDRAVYITESELYTDQVYGYAPPATDTPEFISESYTDEVISGADDE